MRLAWIGFGVLFFAYGTIWLIRGETGLGVTEIVAAVGWILVGIFKGPGRLA
jgi:hypothetical protein